MPLSGPLNGPLNTALLLPKLTDFKKYPKMLKMILVLLVHWFLLALMYYGLSFGWHKMADDAGVATV